MIKSKKTQAVLWWFIHGIV